MNIPASISIPYPHGAHVDLWVIEAQYTKGARYVGVAHTEELYVSQFTSLMDEGNMDWVHGYKVRLEAAWERLEDWKK